MEAAIALAIQQALASINATHTVSGMQRTLLRIHQVEIAIGLKKSKIYQMVKDREFPAPVQLGAKSVAWRSDDVAAWIESRPKVSREGGDEGVTGD